MDSVIEDFKNAKLDLSHYEVWQMWLIGAIGLALIFVGYKIKRVAFFIIWFLLGYIGTGYLMPIINSNLPDIAGSDFWQGLLPILGGLILGLMGFMVEKVCIAGIVFGLTILMTAQYFGTEIQTMTIGGIIGAVLAGFATMMMKPATIVATAVAGAYALTLAVIAIGSSNLNGDGLFWPMIIGFSALGSVVQFISCRHE
ncbi:hypothetical protein IJI18_02995 [Candidatus Saccharibacteria bacterium]|nr:hypothetical protein [Candidatus Saccharibacteria bacterium]